MIGTHPCTTTLPKDYNQHQITKWPDPKGVKIEKIPLENIYITYLGNNDELLDITLSQKKIDENGNTYYIELITKSKYTTSQTEPIYVLKMNTFLSLLNQTSDVNLKTIIKNGYLSPDDILVLHDFLNTDHHYLIKNYSRGDGPVWHNCPSFLERYKDQNCVAETDDENLTALVVKLLTENKITVLTGDKGIGKSTLINKLNYYIKKAPNHFIDKEIWKIDYNELIKNVLTTKNIEERIRKTFKFLLEQPNSILFIDNVNFENKKFINAIAKYQKSSKTKLVLISDEKIDENDLDKNVFSTITVTEQKEPTLRKIVKQKIKELKQNTNKDLNLNKQEEDELISILLNSNKTDSLNNNFDKNPILAITILENAFKLATGYNQKEVYLIDFYLALSLDNIKLPKDSIEKTIHKIDELSTKVNERKQQEKTKKTFKEKVKTFFKKQPGDKNV